MTCGSIGPAASGLLCPNCCCKIIIDIYIKLNTETRDRGDLCSVWPNSGDPLCCSHRRPSPAATGVTRCSLPHHFIYSSPPPGIRLLLRPSNILLHLSVHSLPQVIRSIADGGAIWINTETLLICTARLGWQIKRGARHQTCTAAHCSLNLCKLGHGGEACTTFSCKGHTLLKHAFCTASHDGIVPWFFGS